MRTRKGNKDIIILNSAIKIFAEQGFHKAKIESIAIMAGVATGSIYIYYKNKEAILTSIFAHLWEKLYNELKLVVQQKDVSPVQQFDALIDLLFDNFAANSNLAIVFVNEQQHIRQTKDKGFYKFYNGFMELGEEIVTEGKQKKMFNENIDVKIIRTFIFGGLRLLLQQWAQHPEEMSLDIIRKNVKDFTKRGLYK